MTVPIAHFEIDMYDGIKKNKHPKMMAETLEHLAFHHLHHTIGKHFKNVPETQPGGAYGYKKRNRKYTEFKRRRFGHDRPNELTGRSKRFMRNNSKITKTQHKSTLFIKWPLKKNKAGDRNFAMSEQQKREMAAVSKEEQREMQERGVAFYGKLAAKPDNQLKRKKRI